MEYLLIALICYMIGMINPTLLIGFFKRVNVRKTGSRNPGTSNAAMTFGLRYGIFVGIIDILKGAMPVVVLKVMYPDIPLMHVLGGFFVIIGHIFPAVMKFKGGKGTAPFGGFLLAAMPLYGVIMALVYFLGLKIWDYIALSTLFVVTLTPIVMFFYGYDMISIGLLSMYMVISIYLHMPNFARIYFGYEIGISQAFKNNKWTK